VDVLLEYYEGRLKKMLDNSDIIIIIKSVIAPRPTRRKASGGVIFLWGVSNAF
jgi:hypothetical protein